MILKTLLWFCAVLFRKFHKICSKIFSLRLYRHFMLIELLVLFHAGIDFTMMYRSYRNKTAQQLYYSLYQLYSKEIAFPCLRTTVSSVRNSKENGRNWNGGSFSAGRNSVRFLNSPPNTRIFRLFQWQSLSASGSPTRMTTRPTSTRRSTRPRLTRTRTSSTPSSPSPPRITMNVSDLTFSILKSDCWHLNLLRCCAHVSMACSAC